MTQDGALTFGYDATGNRTNAGYATGTGNRTSNDGTWTYTYDAEGNLTKKSKGASAETWVYAYDNRNQMTSAAKSATDGGAATARVTYAYDAFGNRIQRQEWTGAGTTTERFGVDGWDPAKPTPVGTENFDTWADLDGSNNLVSWRAFGTEFNEVAAKATSAGAVSWYWADRQGSVRQVTNVTGTLTGTLNYDAYGKTTSSSGAVDRYAYAGMELDDDTGDYYDRARMYNPTLGRFISEDPKGFAAGDENLYRYVENGPTNATDPSGMWLVIPESEKEFWTNRGKQLATPLHFNFHDYSPGYLRLEVPTGEQTVGMHHLTYEFLRSLHIGWSDALVKEGLRALYAGNQQLYAGSPANGDLGSGNRLIVISAPPGTPPDDARKSYPLIKAAPPNKLQRKASDITSSHWFYGRFTDYYGYPRIPDWSRQEFSGSSSMRTLGIPKYQPGLFNYMETDLFRQFQEGCVGLSAIRLGLPWGGRHHEMEGLRVFNHLEAAYRAQLEHKDPAKISIIFAIQTTKTVRDFEDFVITRTAYGHSGWCEYKPEVIKRGNVYPFDFATGIQDRTGNVVIWESMPSGISENTNLTVVHKPRLTKDTYRFNFYCVVEVPKHKFQPPVLPLEGREFTDGPDLSP